MKNYFIDTQDLQDFCLKCNAICSSKLILADKKISNLLKTIAGSEGICRLLEKCLDGFNYKIEFLKSKIPDTKKQGKFEIVLPEDEKLIAYVFCLLCEFENKEKDLTQFLIDYYGFEDLFNDGFANFCNKIIIPFKNTVVSVSSNIEKEIKEIVKPDLELVYQELNIKDNAFIKINKLYRELIRNINKESQLNTEERKHYLMVAGAFLSAFEKKDAVLSDVLLIALKYMSINYRFLVNKVRAIEKIFELIKNGQDINEQNIE